jgi:methylmalonyl-CoA mutase
VFGGGGGVIVPEEIASCSRLRRRAHLQPGGRAAQLGLTGMIGEMVRDCDKDLSERAQSRPRCRAQGDIATKWRAGQHDHRLEEGKLADTDLALLRKQWALAGIKTPVLGITGTGGAGKSSLTDELLLRFRSTSRQAAHRGAGGRPTRGVRGGACSATASA